MNLVQNRGGDTVIENTLMDVVGGEEGEGEMYGKSNMETYITRCKIGLSSGNLLHDSGNWNHLCNNLEGWDGEGPGRDVRVGGDMS